MSEQSAEPLRLVYMDPKDLDDNPANWRTHPDAQKTALADAIGEVGWAGALLFNEASGHLVDGHARKELWAGKGKVPVLIGSWTEEQEKKILLTLDPLSAMAEANKVALDNLLRDVTPNSVALQELAASLADEAGLYKTGGPTADEPELGEESEGESGGEEEESGGGLGGFGQTIQYTICFDDDAQQSRWYSFLRGLREKYPELSTVGARLDKYLAEQG